VISAFCRQLVTRSPNLDFVLMYEVRKSPDSGIFSSENKRPKLARSLPLPIAMKLDISCLAAFVSVGNDLLARAAMQGVEQAVLATAIEYGSAAIACLSTRTRASAKLCSADQVPCNAAVQR
jgi:hypothetical protein